MRKEVHGRGDQGEVGIPRPSSFGAGTSVGATATVEGDISADLGLVKREGFALDLV